MRLRFWNTLAVALGAFVTFGFPTWTIIKVNAAQSAEVKANFSTCMAGRHPSGYRIKHDRDYCRETFKNERTNLMGFSNWLLGVRNGALISSLMYVFVFFLVRLTSGKQRHKILD